MPTVAELDVKINADDDATSVIARLDALIRGLDGDDIDVDVDVDTGSAEADIAHLIEEINSISDENVNIETDIDGAVEDIARLEAELKAIPDETVTIETDVDDAPIKRANNSMNKFRDTSLNASRQVSFLAAAVLGLGTALIPIGAVGVGGVVALTGALTAATVGAGLFGLVATSAFEPVADALQKMHKYQLAFSQATTDKQRDAAMEKMAALMGSLTQEQRDMVISVENFRGAWGRLVAQFQPDVFKIATEGLDGLTKILPSLAPIIDSTAGALLFLERAAVRALQGPFWQSFISMIGTQAGPMLRLLGLSFGNLITGFAALVGAFMPLSVDFSHGLLDMTASFSKWAQNVSQTKGFQDFVTYIRENTPLVLDLIGKFVLGFIAIAKAGAPLGESLLKVTTRVFEMIAAFQKAHPTMLTTALLVLGVGAVLLNVIGPMLTIIKFAGYLASGFGLIGTAAGALAGVLGTSAAVVLGVAAVIAALVVGIIYAYNHFQTFHDIVNNVAGALVDFGKTVWSAVVGAFQSVVAWLSSTFGPAIHAVVDFVVEQFNKVRDWASENAGTFSQAWSNILSVASRIVSILWNEITGALSQISAVWNLVWPTLAAVLSGVWTAIKGIVSGALDIIMGLILVFGAVFAGDWGRIWTGIVQILTGIWEIIKGIVLGGLQVLQALVHAYLEIVRTIFGAAWSLIIAGLTAAWNTIKSIISAAWGVIVTIFSAFQRAVQASVNAFWSAVIAIFRGGWSLVTSGLSAAWNTAKTLTSSAWSAIVSTVTTYAGRIVSAVRDKIGDAVDKVRSFGPDAVAAISSVGTKFYNAGASLLKSLADGITSGVSNAVGAVQGAIGRITDFLPGSPAKVGPLSGDGYAYIRGQHLAEDLAAGLTKRNGLVKQAAQHMADLLSLSTTTSGSFSAAGGNSGGVTISVGEGAVVLQLAAGIDPNQARAAFDGAGETIAGALLTTLRRQGG